MGLRLGTAHLEPVKIGWQKPTTPNIGNNITSFYDFFRGEADINLFYLLENEAILSYVGIRHELSDNSDDAGCKKDSYDP